MEGNRHVLFLQVWSTLVSGEVKTVVHLIREDSLSRYMPFWTDHGPFEGKMHDTVFYLELNPFLSKSDTIES